jgi:hypothetical protein
MARARTGIPVRDVVHVSSPTFGSRRETHVVFTDSFANVSWLRHSSTMDVGPRLSLPGHQMEKRDK